MNRKNTRIAEVLQEDGSWVTTHPLDIKQGMTFRLFEENGEPIFFLDDNQNLIYNWMASEDTYIDEDGIFCTKIKI